LRALGLELSVEATADLIRREGEATGAISLRTLIHIARTAYRTKR
jgi:hypothetical protein